MTPLQVIAVGMGFAGGFKLSANKMTRSYFEHWGYGQSARVVVGAIEVGIASTAVAAMRDPTARPIAAIGTLAAMACAIATHAQAHDAAPNYAMPVPFVVAAAAVLAGR